jgi:hypothetical protein
MENIYLENNFSDTPFVLFIRDITNKLYDNIHTDYVEKNFSDYTNDYDKIEYAKHKMNVLLDICRYSGNIKKLSSTYGMDDTNSKLYIRFMITLYSIHTIYIKILYLHPDYDIYKNKMIHLYSGMKSVPLEGNTLKNTLPIDTTLLPVQFFVHDNKSYYIHFEVLLDDLIIPIIGSCMRKFRDLGYLGYEHNTHVSEYEFLYIGICDINFEDKGIVNTHYMTNYDIYNNMNPVFNIHSFNTFFEKVFTQIGEVDYNTIITPDYIVSIFGDDEVADKLANYMLNTNFSYIKYDHFWSTLNITEKIIKLIKLLLIKQINLQELVKSNDTQFNQLIHYLKYLFDYIRNSLKDHSEKITTYIDQMNIYFENDSILSVIQSKYNETYVVNNTPETHLLNIISKCNKQESFRNIVKYDLQQKGGYFYKYKKYKNKYIFLCQSK